MACLFVEEFLASSVVATQLDLLHGTPATLLVERSETYFLALLRTWSQRLLVRSVTNFLEPFYR